MNRDQPPSSTRAYSAWARMKYRCANQKSKDYAGYGGRGIKVCERWEKFSNFLADMGEPPPGLTLGRRDNDGDYEPSNCRWETVKQQSRNRRSSLLLTIGGITRSLAEWCEQHTSVRYDTVRTRMKNGWPPTRALFQRVEAKKRNSLCRNPSL